MRVEEATRIGRRKTLRRDDGPDGPQDPGQVGPGERQVGPHFGLTPKKYQSGETDYSGRISKIGDASVRTAL